MKIPELMKNLKNSNQGEVQAQGKTMKIFSSKSLTFKEEVCQKVVLNIIVFPDMAKKISCAISSTGRAADS